MAVLLRRLHLEPVRLQRGRQRLRHSAECCSGELQLRNLLQATGELRQLVRVLDGQCQSADAAVREAQAAARTRSAAPAPARAGSAAETGSSCYYSSDCCPAAWRAAAARRRLDLHVGLRLL